jgi:hypothetical protein
MWEEKNDVENEGKSHMQYTKRSLEGNMKSRVSKTILV